VNPDHKDSDGRSFWFSLLNFPLPKIEKELEDMINYLLEKIPEKILESSKEGFTAIESGLVYVPSIWSIWFLIRWHPRSSMLCTRSSNTKN